MFEVQWYTNNCVKFLSYIIHKWYKNALVVRIPTIDDIIVSLTNYFAFHLWKGFKVDIKIQNSHLLVIQEKTLKKVARDSFGKIPVIFL